jgi:hypothetical protein
MAKRSFSMTPPEEIVHLKDQNWESDSIARQSLEMRSLDMSSEVL